MSKPVIEVKNISKRYRIGGPVKKEETFAGQVLHTLIAPIKNLRNLRKLNRFKEDDETIFWALQDINFEVQQGEVLGIIGHNGAGKSTLLKLLSRITEPTTGEIILRGRVNSLLEVGTGFHPDLSGRDNIYMNGTILGMTKKEIDRKLEEIIEFSGVAKYIDTPVKRYSSGMTVRLAFSVAAHLEPEILIIDEVLAVGDAEFQKKCLGKMKEVSGQGRTVLFVSHNMPAVQTLCSQALWLEKGRIKQIGETSLITSNYLRGYQQGLIHGIWERKDIPTADCYFQKIVIKPEKGEKVLMGDDIFISFEVFSLIQLDQFQTCVKVFDEDHSLITVLYNTDFGLTFKLKEGKNFFHIRLSHNNLLPGSYLFSFIAMYNYGQQVFDQVQDAIKLEIITSDVTGTGIPLLKDRGKIWLKIIH